MKKNNSNCLEVVVKNKLIFKLSDFHFYVIHVNAIILIVIFLKNIYFVKNVKNLVVSYVNSNKETINIEKNYSPNLNKTQINNIYFHKSHSSNYLKTMEF